MKEFKLTGGPVLAPTRIPAVPTLAPALTRQVPPQPTAAAQSLPSPQSFPPSPISQRLTDPLDPPHIPPPANTRDPGSDSDYDDDHDDHDQDNASEPESSASAAAPTKKQHAFPCTYAGCTKSYKRQCLLDEHVRTHTGEKPFTCPHCAKSFARQRNLQQHLPIHAALVPKPFACGRPGCGKAFRLKGQLRDHEQRHDVPKPFGCTEAGCTAAFAKHSQLRKHVAEHAGKLPYACTWDACSMSFPTPSKLAKHVARHENPKSYLCPRTDCGLGFPTWSALQAHIRGDHPTAAAPAPAPAPAAAPSSSASAPASAASTNPLPPAISSHSLDAWPCPTCPKVLKSKYSRDQHVRKLHPEPGAPPPATFPCTEPGCAKVLATKSSLRLHVRTLHLGIKPVECPECGRGFATRAFMDRHFASAHGPKKTSKRKRVEEAEDNGEVPDLIAELTGGGSLSAAVGQSRKYACTQCPRRFVREYDLKRHVAAAHDKGEVGLGAGAGVVIGKDGWARMQVDGRTAEAKRRRVGEAEGGGLPRGLRPVRPKSASTAAAATSAPTGQDCEGSDSASEFELGNEMDAEDEEDED